MIENLFQRRCTRRELLKGAAGGAVIGGSEVLTSKGLSQLTGPITDQLIASTKAGFSNEWFLEENKNLLLRLRIGGSFSPEQVSFLNETDRGNDPKEVLRVTVEDLSITDLRLGIRWSHVMFQNNKVDLSYYKPYIDYCLKAGVNLCLNAGIKTFRWPEQHIPYFLKDNLPPKGAIITPNIEIAKRAMDYLHLLFSGLTSEYGKDLHNNTPIIQIENEPFIPFGEYGWTMSDDYLQQVNNIAKPYFPNSKFLINSAPFIVEPVSSLLSRLSMDGIKPVYGIDYYYKIDDQTNGDNWMMQLPLLNSLDLLTLSKIAGKPIIPKDLHNLDIEITEGQFEGWGKYVTPGNSAKEFRYLLYRCINDIFGDRTDNNMLIRLWGLEAFAQKIMNKTLTPEHKEIRGLILAINQNNN